MLCRLAGPKGYERTSLGVPPAVTLARKPLEACPNPIEPGDLMNRTYGSTMLELRPGWYYASTAIAPAADTYCTEAGMLRAVSTGSGER